MILTENSQFRLIEEDVSWQVLFERWAEHEENNPEWQNVARSKGWENWREWRSFMAQQFEAAKRRWNVYEIVEPGRTLPQMLVGPFQGPQSVFLKGYEGDLLTGTFENAAHLNRHNFLKHPKISSIQQNFPAETELFGLYFPNGKVMCMEGTHRSLAVAIAEMMNTPIDFSRRRVSIALTEARGRERELLLKMLERGSEKRT